MSKYKRWEKARQKRIAQYDKKIEDAVAKGDSLLAASLRDQRDVEATHTAGFWQNKWTEIKRFLKGIGKDVKDVFRGGKREFQSTWNAMSMESEKGEVMKEMKYDLQFNTGYKTALQEYRASRRFVEEARAAEKERLRQVQELEAKGEEVPEDLRAEIKEPEVLRLKDLQKMSTVEFAKKYRDEIMADYRKKRQSGMNSYAAKAEISNEWFGSL